MEKNEFDLLNFDSLSLALKEEELERMLSYYRAFGWEVFEKREDKRYFDIVHIRLFRPHKIKNKDRLQLLQVKMESSVNRLAIDRKNKHSRSTAVGISVGVGAAFLVGAGIYLAVSVGSTALIATGSVMAAVGLALGAILVPYLRKTVKAEKAYFAARFKETASEIARILSGVKRLTGGEDSNE